MTLEFAEALKYNHTQAPKSPMFMAMDNQKKNVTGRPSTSTATVLLAIQKHAKTAMNTAWNLDGCCFHRELMPKA